MNVGDNCGLEHNWHVRGVEQLDRIRALLAADAGRLYGEFNAEALQIDDDKEDENGREQVHHVWQV